MGEVVYLGMEDMLVWALGSVLVVLVHERCFVRDDLNM